MAELHILGEVVGGVDFGGQRCFCLFEIVTGSQWSLIEGYSSGCTHIMDCGEEGMPWCFPIDVHYAMNSIQGWPKLALQVWSMDGYGRKNLVGYGTCFVPLPTQDEVEIEVPTWRPAVWYPSALVRLYENLRVMIMGGNPQLRDDSLVYSSDERFKLQTISSGTVRVKLNVLSRGMKRLGMIYA